MAKNLTRARGIRHNLEIFLPTVDSFIGSQWMLLVKGILCGLGAAVPIGPVNVEIARRALRAGFWPAVALGCGAVSVDVVYCIVAAVGAIRLSDNPWIYWPVAAAGVIILTYLGVISLRGARSAGRAHLLDR